MESVPIGFHAPQKGATLTDICTPALVVDRDLFEENISLMMRNFADGTVSVRPHLKTGKSPIIARILLEAGARGICVAKTGEAYVMAKAGISDVLITSPIGHPTTASWLAALVAAYPDIKLVVDSEHGARILADAMNKCGARAKVLIDVNVGQNRTGVAPDKAGDLADVIASLRCFELIGCQGYEGHLQFVPQEERGERVRAAMEMLLSAVASVRQKHEVQVVTTGGTGTCMYGSRVPGITEIQPGSFIFMDSTYKKALPDSGYSTALQIMGTVLSKTRDDCATIDVGCKSVSTEYGMPVPVLNDCVYAPAGDEHGTLTGAAATGLVVGDRVMLVPSHIDTTVALHDFYFVMRAGILEELWPVSSRGRVQ